MVRTTDADAWTGVSPSGPWRLRFVVFWTGQFIGLTGLALAIFGMSADAFTVTPSLAVLGVFMSITWLPFVIAAPFAGSLIDRWGPQRSLILSNALGLLNLLLLLVFNTIDFFAFGRVMVFLWFAAAIKALHLAAFETAVPFLVPRRHLGRANGGRMALTAVGALLGAALAGSLILALGSRGVAALGSVTFGLSILSLNYVRVPWLSEGPEAAASSSLLSEFRDAVRCMFAIRGLTPLMLILAAVNVGIGTAEFLIAQLTVFFPSSDTLDPGVVIGLLGLLGLSLGTLWVILTDRPRHHVRGVVVASLTLAAALVIGGLRPNVFLLAAAAFLFLGSTAVITGRIQTISQLAVEPSVFGRTAAIRNICIGGPYMMAQMALGPIAAFAFLPLVGEDEVRFDALTALVGSGGGRAFALLMSSVGVLLAITVVITFRRSSLPTLERGQPDDGQPQVADRRSTVRAGS